MGLPLPVLKTSLETPGTSAIITAKEMQDRGALNLVDGLSMNQVFRYRLIFQSGFSSTWVQAQRNQYQRNGRESNFNKYRCIGNLRIFDSRWNGRGRRIYFDLYPQSDRTFKSANSVSTEQTRWEVWWARTVSPAGVIGKDSGSGLVNATTYASVNDSINNRLLTAWGDDS